MGRIISFEPILPRQRDAFMKIPLVRPNPPKLSALVAELEAVEASGVFSNYGPVNTRLEQEFLRLMFDQTGACVTVCNATIGLMSALKHVAKRKPNSRNFALMPAFTFAAAAHAALWAGLTPLLCDIDAATWMPSKEAEDRLLEQFGADIAVIFPYATFGNCLDLDRYDAISRHYNIPIVIDAATWMPSKEAEDRLLDQFGDDIAVIFPYATFGNCLNLDRYDAISRRYNIPVVIDAAASLGSLTNDHRAFGTGFAHPVVFSMHATKAFAVGEAGLVYSTNEEVIEVIRAMGNFGFGQPRSATMPGLNSKLTEIGALIALAKLREFDMLASYRSEIAELYRTELSGWTFQHMCGSRHAQQFMPVLLPEHLAGSRQKIIAELAARDIGAAAYFSPHIAEQPYFQQNCLAADLTVTHNIASRILSLPISDLITPEEVTTVCQNLQQICHPAFAPIPVGG
jgi:dTDP-4-amino-4,6-dideoxygalactose transaminase